MIIYVCTLFGVVVGFFVALLLGLCLIFVQRHTPDLWILTAVRAGWWRIVLDDFFQAKQHRSPTETMKSTDCSAVSSR